MSQDLDHLKILGIFYYIFAGFSFLFGLVFSVYIVMGTLMVADPSLFTGNGGEAPPEFLGWVFIGVGAFIILVALTLAFLYIKTARSLRNQTHYRFCFVLAVISCLSVPLGTVLGVFTLVVLSRDTVKALFENK